MFQIGFACEIIQFVVTDMVGADIQAMFRWTLTHSASSLHSAAPRFYSFFALLE